MPLEESLELVQAGKGKRPSVYRLAKKKDFSKGFIESFFEEKGQEVVPPTS